uniref:Uncharacterized protein n=1 Tax=Candidatus Kentrum sp. UNK TaxID=2126344 RepID=A0A451AYL5_9GAMM|nr:MAG: hypothetical protein BECKUNK1418G_GA0071005_10484 [Candidatus Kentron sp. UNK]VFK71142.1 MAG: hypothetical protein BECKUNK1418H_GA0071006_10524 [Candidatus Kentron sp. UNK]
MYNHNPLCKTIRHRFLILCLSILIPGAILAQDGPTTEWTGSLSESKPPTNNSALCDDGRIADCPPRTKDDGSILFPAHGDVCVMREHFSDDESPRDAQRRIRRRFTEMAASCAGTVIGRLERFDFRTDVIQDVMLKIMIEHIKDYGLPIVKRKIVDSKNPKGWLIEVHAKALIPAVPFQKAVDELYDRVTNNEREKRKLREEVAILRGFSRAQQERIEELEAQKTLSPEDKRCLAKLKREKRNKEEKSADMWGLRHLQRREADGSISPGEFEQSMKDFCGSESSFVRKECHKSQTKKAAEEKNIALFVKQAEKLGDDLDPWNRHLLGVAYWRYSYDDIKIEQAEKEMTRAREEARKKSDFDKDKLRKMHYNLALFHAAQGQADEGLKVLAELGKIALDTEGHVLRAVLQSRAAQRNVCTDLRAACGEEQDSADPACAGWRMALERGDCRKDALNDATRKDANTTSGIGLAPDGGLLPLSLVLPDPFGLSD